MTENRRIVSNKIQCLSCKDIIESVHRHDFRYCGCGNVFVDGGKSYLRRGWGKGKPENSFVDLSEFAEDDVLEAP